MRLAITIHEMAIAVPSIIPKDLRQDAEKPAQIRNSTPCRAGPQSWEHGLHQPVIAIGGGFMRKLFIGSLVLSFLALGLTSASAQDRRRRQPHTGSEAVGFEVGAFVPDDDQFNSDLLVNGLFEYYVRPRVSLRTEFGFTDPGHTREPVDSLRQVPLRLDVNYNWEGGVWHPFVGAGIGAYFLRNKDNGVPFGNTMVQAGTNFGGGVEYFLNRRVTVKGEARYHRIDQPLGGPDPSGWALTLGLKHYY
jgi:hypothetical protein